jgi:formyl-CoA transferase
MIQQGRLPDGREMKIPGIVPKLAATPGGTRWLGPKLGEHTREVLAELGYDDGRIAALKARGII